MTADYHIHTFLCKHAKGTVPEYVAVARDKGLEEICFADHAPAPCGYDANSRMALEQFAEYRAMVEAARAPGAPRILFGIEADYYPDCECFQEAWLAEQDFDLVMGSVHFIRDWSFDSPSQRKSWETVNVPQAWADYFRLVVELAQTGLYDVLSHPDLPKKFGYRPPEGGLGELAQPALDAIAAAGMGIEINTSGLRKPVQEIYPTAEFLALARERDIPISLGSDAHSPEEVGHAFDQAVQLARAAGYTHSLRMRKRRKSLAPLPD